MVLGDEPPPKIFAVGFLFLSLRIDKRDLLTPGVRNARHVAFNVALFCAGPCGLARMKRGAARRGQGGGGEVGRETRQKVNSEAPAGSTSGATPAGSRDAAAAARASADDARVPASVPAHEQIARLLELCCRRQPPGVSQPLLRRTESLSEDIEAAAR